MAAEAQRMVGGGAVKPLRAGTLFTVRAIATLWGLHPRDAAALVDTAYTRGIVDIHGVNEAGEPVYIVVHPITTVRLG